MAHTLARSLVNNTGYDRGSLNPDDFDGKVRPRGVGYDICAYEFLRP